MTAMLDRLYYPSHVDAWSHLSPASRRLFGYFILSRKEAAAMKLCLFLLAIVAGHDDSFWPAFLGDGGGQIDPASLPIEWSPDRNLAWTVDLEGYGQSSPVIQNGRVFVTSVTGEMKNQFHVLAYDLADGKQLWKHSVDSSELVKSSYYVSRAAPTPVSDPDHIICFFESGDLVGLDHDGNLKWERSLTKEYGPLKNRFCIGSSLAQDENNIFVLVDHDGPSYLIAINKKTGETAWKQERTSRISWSSPALLPINGKTQIVVSSAGTVDGYDPKSGELLWSTDEIGGNTTPTPRTAGDGQFLIGASAGSRGESTEIASTSNCLMRVTIGDDGPLVSKVWLAEKALSSFGSPVYYEGYAYWVNRAGVVFCFDGKTGAKQYSERLAESNWATPLAVGDRIYFFGRNGDTSVIKSGPEFKKLATNRLWKTEVEQADQGQRRGNFGGQTQYGVAAVNGSLVVRTGDVLYCIRKEKE